LLCSPHTFFARFKIPCNRTSAFVRELAAPPSEASHPSIIEVVID
jgi:hypothetical protein